ncbi:MAG: ferritin-like domain-containing protein [Gammaproteobacteria bacterium]
MPWDELEPARIASDETMFFLLASASFVEITTDLYTQNLVEHYAGDSEVVNWLSDHWQPEELQHGVALKRYVQKVWPDFDWDRAYQGFFAEYAKLCNAEQLEVTRTQEMVARCMVETGTSSYYTMLRDFCTEPLLKRIAHYIRNDEIGHYKYFYRYFRQYAEREHVSRWAILQALWTRIREIDTEDGLIAYKHAFQVRHPDLPFDPGRYEQFRRTLNSITRAYFPFALAARMTLKPLNLPTSVERWSIPLVVSGARYFLKQ